MLQKVNQPRPPQAARASAYALAASLVCLLCLLAPALAQQPDNSNSRGGRTKRVTPLKTSDSQSGARVTITSDGELNDYSAYRSGDRFIVVIPQAEGGGGAARGRGFEGAQVSRRGKDLVYTFKLEPGASARVNQRFNRLDVQFTASKAAATQTANNASAAPSPTPRAPRTPPEIAGLPSPTPAARATPDARLISEAGQQTAAGQPATTPQQQDASSGFPLFPAATPDAAAASPTVEPSVAPTAAATEQIAQAQPQQQPAPGSAVAQPATNPAQGATLGATLVSNWPWIIAALLALFVGLLFVGRRAASREQQEVLPPASMAVPSLRETKAVPATAKPAPTTTAAPATPTATAATTTNAKASTPATPPVVAPPVPLVAPTAAKAAPVADPRGKKKKKKGKGKVTAAPQFTADKAEPVPVDAAPPVAPIDAAPLVAPEAAEAMGGDVDLTKAVAPAVASVVPLIATVAATDESESAEAVDSERIGVEVKNLLAGESYDESVVAASDAATRQLVAAELAAALTGRNAARQNRARAAFHAHGYFDDATRDLQSAEAPGRRAAAAQALSLVGDRAATPHLVAALEDPSADVRRAAVEALAELRDPAAVGPLEALRWREQSRQVPRQLIMRAVEMCAESAAEEEEVTRATQVAETETTLVRDERERETPAAPVEPEPAAPSEASTSNLTAAPESKEIELATALETAAPAEAVEEPSLETPAAPSAEAVATTAREEDATSADESFVEPARAETFVESAAVESVAAAVESVAAEGRAVEAGEGGAVAGVVESAASAESVASFEPDVEESVAAESSVAASPVDEPHVSVAGEETPVAETESAAGGEAVYTFDEEEAAAWAERRAAPAREPEEDLLAELDALEAAAQSRATREAEARPTYAAPEFALREEKPVAEDRLELEVEVDQTGFDEAMAAALAEPVAPAAIAEPAAPAESFAPAEEPTSAASAESAGVAGAASVETAERADAIKSVELFDEATAEAETAQPTAEEDAETSFAIEPFRPEAAAETTFTRRAPEAAPQASDEVRLAPALEETQSSARGLAAADDAATVIDAPRHEKGLSASLDDDAGISIIPKAIQLRLESDDSHERAQSVLALARLNTDEAFTQICAAFDDRAEEVRDAAARALYEVSEDRAESFTRALREASAERRRNIGAALASSGLADDAVSQLTGESRDRTYDAFSLLFLMAKAGETAPLIKAIESHPDNEVRLAVVKLLALSGQQEVLPSFRRLAVRGSLPTDVRAAVMEAIYQISSSGTAKTPAATKP